MKPEDIIEKLKKKGQCPDCNKKANKCKCEFKELYITLKINDILKELKSQEKRR